MFVGIASKMEKRAIIAILVCLFILDNACKGSPIPSQATKDSVSFTSSSFLNDDHLENFHNLRGTQPVPRKLLSLPTNLHSVQVTDDLADDESDTTSEENIQIKASDTSQKSSEDSLPRGKPKVSWRHDRGSSNWQRKSTSEKDTLGQHPDVVTSSGIRWQVAHLPESKDDGKKVKKKKTKKKTHDPSESGSAAIVAGICAGILVLLCIVSGLVRLWKNCKKRSRKPNGAELGLVTPWKTQNDVDVSEEVVYEKKVTGGKKKSGTKSKSDSKPKTSTQPDQLHNYTVHSAATPSDATQDFDLTPATHTTGHTLTEVCIVNESLDSLYDALPSSSSPVSEPSTWTPNETPPSTPNNTPSLTSVSDMTWTFSKESFSKVVSETYFTTASFENMTASDTKLSVSSPLQAKTSAESSCLSKGSGESVPIESDKTNSSESCKTPVAPLNEVIITMEDEEQVKLVLVPSIESSKEHISTDKSSGTKENVDGKVSGKNENVMASSLDSEDGYLLGSGHESSSGELIYTSELPFVPDNAEVTACKPSLPPPPVTPPTASTELRRGKAFGGRKATENRLIVKHLTSANYSSGFLGDIILAVSKILTNNESFADTSKEKRRVIREQTKETQTSLLDSILLAKVIIMNENVDTAREKKSASRRLIIRKQSSLPAGSTVRSHTPFSQQVALARSVILPSFFLRWVLRRINERCRVIKERVKELKSPSFEEMIQIAASTISPDTRTRHLNSKASYKRRVIKVDAIMLQQRREKSTFLLDIMLGRNIILGPSALNHEKKVHMKCNNCYFCNLKKMGGPTSFNPPRFTLH